MKLENTVHLAMVLAMLCVLALISAPAWSQATHSFDFEWTDPVEREDNAAFDPETEIAWYVLQCSRDEAFTAPAETYVAQDQTTVLAPGKRAFAWVDAVSQGGWYYCRINVADIHELVSDWSRSIYIRKLARPKAADLAGRE